MTVVEFFDRAAIENIISCIALDPSRIVYVGIKNKMKAFEDTLRSFIAQRNKQIEISFCPINKNDLSSIVETLEGIVESNDELEFDLTGGDDISLFAAGIVFARHPECKIAVHDFNVVTGRIHDCDMDGVVAEIAPPEISVEENILLHGGIVNKSASSSWDINEELISDINFMWDLCRDHPFDWNTQTNILNLPNQQITSSSPCKIYPDMKRGKYSESQISDMLSGTFAQCAERGLFKYEIVDEQYIITFKNKQIKEIICKAGNLLELKTLLTVKGITNKDGSRKFNDAMTGVFIDWDGSIHSSAEDTPDTANEIDVIAMHGLMPVFISCKNGSVSDEELYKLNTVAGRFGGKFTKKVLVLSSSDKVKNDLDHFMQRAKDMKIAVVDNVAAMSDDEFAKALDSAIGL